MCKVTQEKSCEGAVEGRREVNKQGNACGRGCRRFVALQSTEEQALSTCAVKIT